MNNILLVRINDNYNFCEEALFPGCPPRPFKDEKRLHRVWGKYCYGTEGLELYDTVLILDAIMALEYE